MLDKGVDENTTCVYVHQLRNYLRCSNYLTVLHYPIVFNIMQMHMIVKSLKCVEESLDTRVCSFSIVIILIATLAVFRTGSYQGAYCFDGLPSLYLEYG